MSRIFFTLFLIFSSIGRLSAMITDTIIQPKGTIGGDSHAPVTILSNIITYAIGMAAIIGVMGITWGGIQMILATGEDEKMKKARYIMIYSILGVIIAGLAYGIVSLIGQISI